MTLQQRIDAINREWDSGYIKEETGWVDTLSYDRRRELQAKRSKLAIRKYQSQKAIEAHPGVDEVMICCGQVIVYIAEGWRADDRTSTVVGEKLADVALGVACIERGEVD
tara:strand:+ start:94 stop:423 length:330 start_codon:yes stop_codon:yes gene_type:complete